MELKGFYFPGSVIEIHHYYHTSSSSEVIRAKVELSEESSLGESVELLRESSLGDRVEMPRDFPFIPYLQRYGAGQLSPIREESPPLVNTSTKPFYV